MVRYRVLAMLLVAPLSAAAATVDDGLIINPPVVPPPATLVAFEFPGWITSVSGSTFGLTVAVNDPVRVSFRYDASKPANFDTGSVAGYIQTAPSGMSLFVGGIEIRSQDYNSFQVINNSFGIDNINGYFTPVSTTGPVLPQNSSISFGLTDSSQSVFSSTALPTQLRLSDFDGAFGSAVFNFFEPSNTGSINFSLGTINPVPLPAAAWLLASVLGVVGVGFGRRRTR